MRQVLHAHREGWVAALDHPKAVVVDYPDQILRQGLNKLQVRGRAAFRCLAFLLRSPDAIQTRTAIAQAVYDNPCRSDYQITQIIHAVEPILSWLEMTVETVDGGYRLHTEPRETLACCRTLAPGQPLPPRLKSTRAGRAMRPTTCAGSRARSTISSAR